MTAPRLILTLAVALAPAAALAQPPGGMPGMPGMPGFGPPPTRTLSYEGYEVFRWLLHRAQLTPLTDDEIRRGPRGQSDYVVIVLGSPNTWLWTPGGQQNPGAWIDGALTRGGAVLVANDQPATLSLNAAQIGQPLQFSGFRVSAGDAPRFAGRDDSPFADPVVEPLLPEPEWKLFGGDAPLERVATLNPGSIVRPQGRGKLPRVLAGFAPGTKLGGPFGQRVGDQYVFAVGQSEDRPANGMPFRSLALADQAVFQNGLMVSHDENGLTDNLEFAERAVGYLTESPGKKRTKCLLIANGQVVGNYDELNRLLRPPLPLPKLPPWEHLEPKLVDLGNQIVDRVQENDTFHKAVMQTQPDRPGSMWRYLLAGLLFVAALWALISLVRRVWGARQPTDLAPPPPGGRPPPPPDGAAGVFGRRGRELAGRDNLLEPARASCRDFFDQIGGPPDPGPRLPKVVISDVVRKPDTLRQALRDLWAVAYGRPVPVTAMRWAALEPLIPRALAAHRAGKWRFVEAEDWRDPPGRPRGEA
jgi:hypothetical protein